MSENTSEYGNVLTNISMEQNIVCGCCKDVIENDDILKTIISCGHQYHYDCIYNAFLGNQNRGKLVLECPYCRKKVNPLPEKDGFNYNNAIHSGILCYGEGNKHEYKWSIQHQGVKYCAFSKDGKYCNYFGASFGVGKKYCWKHHNTEHLGINSCKYINNNNFCNFKVETDQEFCVQHKEYAFAKYCKYVTQQGKHKGTICNKYTFDDNGLCLNHCKYANKVNNITEPEPIDLKIPCIEIIKTGIKKGNTCGVLNCKRHNKVKNVDNSNINQINETKIIELKVFNDKPVQVEVKKTIENNINMSINLDLDAVNEIKTKLMNDIYPELSEKNKNIVNLLITKYFK
jgi:hypothetical protein